MFRESPELGSVDDADKAASQRPRLGLSGTRRCLSIRGSRMFSGKKYLEVDREPSQDRRAITDDSYLVVLGAGEQRDGRVSLWTTSRRLVIDVISSGKLARPVRHLPGH
jgi:hypothetical protein